MAAYSLTVSRVCVRDGWRVKVIQWPQDWTSADRCRWTFSLTLPMRITPPYQAEPQCILKSCSLLLLNVQKKKKIVCRKLRWGQKEQGIRLLWFASAQRNVFSKAPCCVKFTWLMLFKRLPDMRKALLSTSLPAPFSTLCSETFWNQPCDVTKGSATSPRFVTHNPRHLG